VFGLLSSLLHSARKLVILIGEERKAKSSATKFVVLNSNVGIPAQGPAQLAVWLLRQPQKACHQKEHSLSQQAADRGRGPAQAGVGHGAELQEH